MADIIIFTANPLIYGSCGQIPMETSDKNLLLVSTADTVAVRQGKWTSVAKRPNSIGVPTLTMEATTDDDSEPAWIEGSIDEIETVQLEAPSGTSLLHIGGVKFVAYGLTHH